MRMASAWAWSQPWPGCEAGFGQSSGDELLTPSAPCETDWGSSLARGERSRTWRRPALAAAVAVIAVLVCIAVLPLRRSGAPSALRPGSSVELAKQAPLVCAEVGEDCRPTGCCSLAGWKCYEKDRWFSGCRPNCTAGEPDPEATGEAAKEPWTCHQPQASCSCKRQCRGHGGCPDFPEIDYIYIPESEEDMSRLDRLTDEYDRHLSCGGKALRKVDGVDPETWPQGEGGYDRVEKYGRELPNMQPDELIWTPNGMQPVGDNAPWWNAHHLSFAEVDDQGQSTWVVQKGLKHHAGCSLSHFVTWMDAKSRGIPAMIIAESDAFLTDWWVPYVGGAPDEFDGVVVALLEDAPTDWDVIYLDKGRHGVRPEKKSVKQLSRECWGTPYDVYEWTGDGQAGATMYMVSDRFLRSVPQIIHDVGFDMVDGWLGDRCNPNKEGPVPGGQLRCYSVVAAEPPEPCDRICFAEGQAATCKKRLLYAARAEGGKDACDVARGPVLEQCHVCSECSVSKSECKKEAMAGTVPSLTFMMKDAANTSRTPATTGDDADVEGPPLSAAAMTHRTSTLSGEDDSASDADIAHEDVDDVDDFLGRPPAHEDGDEEDVAVTGKGADSDDGSCSSPCRYEGRSATCRERLKYAVESLFADQPDACAAAYRLVRKQCSSCLLCAPPAELCSGRAAEKAAPPAPSPPTSSDCAVECEFEGLSATCAERVDFAASEVSLEESDPCRAAHELVLSQCDSCGSCTLDSACQRA